MQLNINTLAELIAFFSQADKSDSAKTNSSTTEATSFHIYEMGRSIRKISRQAFAEFESTQSPWPYPFLNQAWFALVFTEQKQEQDFTVWFLKFPLDEQAKLNQVARNDYLKQFIDSIYIDKPETVSQESAYGYTPNDEKRANFNAIVKKQLGFPASSYFKPCLDYIAGQTELQQWQNLGYQGIADVCARLDEKHQGKSLLQSLYEIIPQLPNEPFQAFSTCLENHVLNNKLAQQIYQRAINTELDSDMSDIACLRALSQTAPSQDPNNALNRLVKKVLPIEETAEKVKQSYSIELMAVLSGRCWQHLKPAETMIAFLEALARVPEGQESFNVIVADLLFIPGMRDKVLQQIRNPQRTEKLSHAIGYFFQSVR